MGGKGKEELSGVFHIFDSKNWMDGAATFWEEKAREGRFWTWGENQQSDVDLKKKMAKSNLLRDIILVAECVFIDKYKLLQQLAIAV